MAFAAFDRRGSRLKMPIPPTVDRTFVFFLDGSAGGLALSPDVLFTGTGYCFFCLERPQVIWLFFPGCQTNFSPSPVLGQRSVFRRLSRVPPAQRCESHLLLPLAGPGSARPPTFGASFLATSLLCRNQHRSSFVFSYFPAVLPARRLFSTALSRDLTGPYLPPPLSCPRRPNPLPDRRIFVRLRRPLVDDLLTFSCRLPVYSRPPLRRSLFSVSSAPEFYTSPATHFQPAQRRYHGHHGCVPTTGADGTAPGTVFSFFQRKRLFGELVLRLD